MIQSQSAIFAMSSSKLPISIMSSTFFEYRGDGRALSMACLLLSANAFRFFGSFLSAPERFGGTMSSMRLGMPQLPQCAAMAPPMTPEPNTATRVISLMANRLLPTRNPARLSARFHPESSRNATYVYMSTLQNRHLKTKTDLPLGLHRHRKQHPHSQDSYTGIPWPGPIRHPTHSCCTRQGIEPARSPPPPAPRASENLRETPGDHGRIKWQAVPSGPGA